MKIPPVVAAERGVKRSQAAYDAAWRASFRAQCPSGTSSRESRARRKSIAALTSSCSAASNKCSALWHSKGTFIRSQHAKVDRLSP